VCAKGAKGIKGGATKCQFKETCRPTSKQEWYWLFMTKIMLKEQTYLFCLIYDENQYIYIYIPNNTVD
jgi:hypothetical protein